MSRPLLIRRSGRRLSIDGPVACVNTTSFAHFLMEELPRLLWALRRYPSLRLLTPPSPPRYIADVYRQLRATGLLQHDPVTTAWPTADLADFVFTQAEAASGFWHGSDQELLRDVFLPKSEPGARTRIYVSRRGTRRSFDNEKQLEERLREEGFRILLMEDLDVRSQIEEFRSAEVVVAPHGAGLANLVWCAPGTRVVEIFSSKVFNDCFARLSSRRACEHLCCWAKGGGEYGSVDLPEVLELIGGAGRHPA